MEINEDNVEIFTKELKKVAQIDSMILETKQIMKPLQERLKQLKIERKEIEKGVCETMEINKLSIAELPNNIGTIEYKVKNSMIPLTQKDVKEKLVLFFKKGPGSQVIQFNSKSAEEKGAELFDYIYNRENRNFIKKEELKSSGIKF